MVDDGPMISIESEGEDEERPSSDVLGSETGPSVTPRVTFLRRLARGDGASVIALVIALSLHASVIAAGIYYYRAFVLEQPPRVLIPKGTATEETAGTGQDGARLAAALMMPFDLSPPGAADPATPPDLSNPPGEFQ